VYDSNTAQSYAAATTTKEEQQQKQLNEFISHFIALTVKHVVHK